MTAGPLLLRYAIACVVFALPSVAIKLAHGFPQRYPALSAQESAIDAFPHSCLADLNVAAIAQTPTCLPPPDGRPAFAVLGDSHADAIDPQLHAFAAAAGWRFAHESHAACPPLLGMTILTDDPVREQSCLDFNTVAIHRIAEDTSVRSVLLVANWAGPAEWEPAGHGYVPGGHATVTQLQSDANLSIGLTATIRLLQAAGKNVFVLQDWEAFRFDPLLRSRAYFIPARSWLAKLLDGPSTRGFAANAELDVLQNAEAAKVVARVAAKMGVTVLDPRNHFCNAQGCQFCRNDVLLFHDTNHPTETGAAIAVEGFQQQLFLQKTN